MKTAISLPDPLFHAAEQFAKVDGLSRSELFARALQLYVQTYQSKEITEALNAVYAEEHSTLDPGFAIAQAQILPDEEW